FEQSQSFAAPVADAGHCNLAQRFIASTFEPGCVERCEHALFMKRHGAKRHVHRKLRLEAMSEMVAGCTDGDVGMAHEKGGLLAACRLAARGARDDRNAARGDLWRKSARGMLECRRDRALLSAGPHGTNRAKSRQRVCPARE